jgi:hypothetical protein
MVGCLQPTMRAAGRVEHAVVAAIREGTERVR